MTSIAVVGGSLGGLRAAEQLRAAGHDGPITVYSAEPHLPYNRPPLSKEVLADPDLTAGAEQLLARLTFRRRASVEDVDFRLGVEVTAADLEGRSLTLADGSLAPYDGLVVATGLRSRRLPIPGPTAHRFALRTVADCLALRGALPSTSQSAPQSAPQSALRVVVVGGGFIGCETACTLHHLGHDVTVIEPTGAPMNRAIGPDLAAAVQRHHEASGLRFRIGPGVTGFAGNEQVEGVILDDGTTVPADLVIEAVGSVCNTEWLEGNGLDLTDGVLTDNLLAVQGATNAVAVGDIARFPNPLIDDVPRRVEHWSMPTDTAKRAAVTLAALVAGEEPAPGPFRPIPSFWSDQGELRFQSFGSPALGAEVRLEEGDLDRLLDGVLTTHYRDGRHVGTIAVNLPAARQRALRQAFDVVPI